GGRQPVAHGMSGRWRLASVASLQYVGRPGDGGSPSPGPAAARGMRLAQGGREDVELHPVFGDRAPRNRDPPLVEVLRDCGVGQWPILVLDEFLHDVFDAE